MDRSKRQKKVKYFFIETKFNVLENERFLIFKIGHVEGDKSYLGHVRKDLSSNSEGSHEKMNKKSFESTVGSSIIT